MCFNYPVWPMVIWCNWRNVVHCCRCTPSAPLLYNPPRTTRLLQYLYILCVTNGGIYLYIRTRVCECSPIIINSIIRTNPKTMTFSACGRGSSTTATLSFALLPYLTIHGGRWTATTQWRPSHIIRLKKKILLIL